MAIDYADYWEYYISGHIHNRSSSDYDDRHIYIRFISGNGTSVGGTERPIIYCENKCYNFPNDIRVGTSKYPKSANQLPQFLVEQTPSSATYLVRIDEHILTSLCSETSLIKPIYIFIGNKYASFYSSGEQIFETFFDDFNNGTLDTSKWSSHGNYYFSGDSIIVLSGTTSSHAYISTQNLFNNLTNRVLVCKYAYKHRAQWDSAEVGFNAIEINSDARVVRAYGNTSPPVFQYYCKNNGSTSSSDGGQTRDEDWHIATIYYSASIAYFGHDIHSYPSIYSGIVPTNNPQKALPITLFARGTASGYLTTLFVDWIGITSWDERHRDDQSIAFCNTISTPKKIKHPIKKISLSPAYGWRSYKQIIISSNNEMQYRFNIYKGEGEDDWSTNTIYCNNRCYNFPYDIRFTDTRDKNNAKQYYQWLEEYNPQEEKAVYWAFLPPSSAIYMYIGNPSANIFSDGENTFLFFDHFSSSTLNPNKWITSQAGPYSVYDSILETSGNWLTKGLRVSGMNFSDIGVELRLKRILGGHETLKFGIQLSSNSSYVNQIYNVEEWDPSWMIIRDNTSFIHQYDSGFPDEDWHRLRGIYRTEDFVGIKADWDPQLYTLDISYNITGNLYIWGVDNFNDTDSYIRLDWIAVRNHVYPTQFSTFSSSIVTKDWRWLDVDVYNYGINSVASDKAKIEGEVTMGSGEVWVLWDTSDKAQTFDNWTYKHSLGYKTWLDDKFSYLISNLSPSTYYSARFYISTQEG